MLLKTIQARSNFGLAYENQKKEERNGMRESHGVFFSSSGVFNWALDQM